MELEQIRAFLVVAEELHFGRAAEKLRIAQPPLSRIIRRLEQELGETLFERTTRRVQLTSAGEALIEPAKGMLNAERLARRAVTAAGQGQIGRVRLAYTGASTHVMVGHLARLVNEAHPGIELELSSQNYAHPALEKVVSGEMDIGLGRWSYIPPGVSTRVVDNEYLVVAVPKGHALAGKRSIRMSDLSDEAFVTLPPFTGSVLDDQLRRLSSNAGFIPRVVQVAPDSWTIVSLVSAGIGCSLTVSSVAANIGPVDVEFIRLEDSTDPIQLRLAWRRDNHSPAVREVLQLSAHMHNNPAR